MKSFNIQIQPDRSPELDVESSIARLSALAGYQSTTEGEEFGRYINIDFATNEDVCLWQSVHEELQKNPALAEASIVVVQGDEGWDHYLLLHHFDPAESLDQILDVE